MNSSKKVKQNILSLIHNEAPAPPSFMSSVRDNVESFHSGSEESLSMQTLWICMQVCSHLSLGLCVCVLCSEAQRCWTS